MNQVTLSGALRNAMALSQAGTLAWLLYGEAAITHANFPGPSPSERTRIAQNVAPKISPK
jgi:hypothetical protein